MTGSIQKKGCAGPLIGLLAMLALVLLMVGSLWLSLRVLSAQFVVAVIAGSATILLSVLFVIVSRHYERHREFEIEQRRRKLPAYEEFMGFWSRLFLTQETDGKPLPVDEIREFSAKFTQHLIIWGSDEVLKEYSTFRQKLNSVDSGRPENVRIMLIAFERLLYEIRKDIGHTNRSLEAGELLHTFVRNSEQVERKDSRQSP